MSREVTHEMLSERIGILKGRVDEMSDHRRERDETVDKRFAYIDGRLSVMNAKLDDLVAIANMGKGAWWAALKFGGILIVVIGAIGWLADRWGGIRKLITG